MPQETATAHSRWSTLLRGPAPVIALLILHFLLGVSAVRNKSMTFDEGVHMLGGMSYWVANDYHLHPENGNWSQRLAALPLWLGGYSFVPTSGEAWDSANLWELSDAFLFDSGNDLDTMLARARPMIGLASVGLGLLVYLWSRGLFGAVGGLVSLTLYTFSPAMLANGFLATSDLLASFFFLASMGAVWRVLGRVSLLNLLAASVSIAGLLLSKMSGVLIVPMAGVLLLLRFADLSPVIFEIGRRREIRGLAAQFRAFVAAALMITAGVVFVIYASYGFRYAAFAPAVKTDRSAFQVSWPDVVKPLPAQLAWAVKQARHGHLLPEGWLWGFCFTLFTSTRYAFLDGACSSNGWARYFPECFLWKTPLSLFFLLGLAAWACRARRQRLVAEKSSASGAAWWYPIAPLLVLWCVYWGVAITSSLNIGHRHILPTYPPLFILAGAAGLWFRAPLAGQLSTASPARKQDASPASYVKFAQIGVIVLLVAQGAETLACWPNYLPYFNVISGGPDNGYRRLVDSSLDWGQELKGLKQWLDAHPDEARDPQHVYLAYFGMARPEYYGIEAESMPGFRQRWRENAPPPLRPGVYCLSASLVQPAYSKYRGRWNVTYENSYRQQRDAFEELIQAGADLPTIAQRFPQWSPEELKLALRDYEVMRLARLCSFLRQREPDEKINYAVHIYRLSDKDIAEALSGPPRELLDKPE